MTGSITSNKFGIDTEFGWQTALASSSASVKRSQPTSCEILRFANDVPGNAVKDFSRS